MYRKKHYAFLIFIFVLLFMPSIVAHAEDIHLSHTLANFTEGADTATLNIILHVENPGVTDYNNLTLSYVPLTVIAVENVSINVENLLGGQSMNVPVTLIVPLPFDQNRFKKEPLFWAGRYINPTGTIVEFPATSYNSGGAQ